MLIGNKRKILAGTAGTTDDRSQYSCIKGRRRFLMQKSSAVAIRAKIKLLTGIDAKSFGTLCTNFGSRSDEFSFFEATLFFMSGYCTTEALFFEFRLSHKILYGLANCSPQVLKVYTT